jgi:plasmid stabilization system protein ParE
MVEQMVLSVEKLLRFPKMGRVVPETQYESIRELLHQNYRIIYRIAGERIEILTIIHGSRELTSRP